MADRNIAEIYELIESILLRLPFEDILRAKAVCKQWRSVIEDSLPLKKALFLFCDRTECVQIDQALAAEALSQARPVRAPILGQSKVDVVPLFKIGQLDHHNGRLARDKSSPT